MYLELVIGTGVMVLELRSKPETVLEDVEEVEGEIDNNGDSLLLLCDVDDRGLLGPASGVDGR